MKEWTDHHETLEWHPPVGDATVGADPVSGLVEGSQVATDTGWVHVENLRPGDRVMTLDGGLQPVQDILRQPLWGGLDDCPQDMWPLHVPAGLVGNARDMLLLPDQAVRLPGGIADPGALVPALALMALPGVERVPPFAMTEVIQLVFGADQLVYGDLGALLHCPAATSPVSAHLARGAGDYHVLRGAAAQDQLRARRLPMQQLAKATAQLARVA